jgi:hypothetical protein
MAHRITDPPPGTDTWVEFCVECRKPTVHFEDRLERPVTPGGSVGVFFVPRCSGLEPQVADRE